MRFLIDENLSNPRLAARLRAQGHDPILAGDAGLLSAADPRVLIWAIGQALPVVTQDAEDFEDLHDLVLAAGGHHPGVLIVRVDADPRHNMSDRPGDHQAGVCGRLDPRPHPRAEPLALSASPREGRRSDRGRGPVAAWRGTAAHRTPARMLRAIPALEGFVGRVPPAGLLPSGAALAPASDRPPQPRVRTVARLGRAG